MTGDVQNSMTEVFRGPITVFHAPVQVHFGATPYMKLYITWTHTYAGTTGKDKCHLAHFYQKVGETKFCPHSFEVHGRPWQSPYGHSWSLWTNKQHNGQVRIWKWKNSVLQNLAPYTYSFTMPRIKGVQHAKFILDVLLHRRLVVMCHLCNIQTWVRSTVTKAVHKTFLHDTNVPLLSTSGRTRFVHSSSLVWAVECSLRDTLDTPTILWVLNDAVSIM